MNREQLLYDALAKMYLWQAGCVNDLLPDALADEVRSLLGHRMVDEILVSGEGDTYETIAARARIHAR